MSNPLKKKENVDYNDALQTEVECVEFMYDEKH